MIGLVMAGGRGSRMRARVEKPLVCFRGKPMVLRVVEAVREAGLTPLVATSGYTRATERVVREAGVEVVRTPGRGFVEDACELVAEFGRLMLVCADMPLLRGRELRWVMEQAGEGCLNVMVRVGLLRKLGISPAPQQGGLAAAGVCVASEAGECRQVVSNNPRLAVNVNSHADLNVAYVLWRELNARK